MEEAMHDAVASLQDRLKLTITLKFII
jgi:hypothetical protein